MHAVGRIACDGQGRLNSKSILLKDGKGNYGEGRHVELVVSQLQNADYSQDRWWPCRE